MKEMKKLLPLALVLCAATVQAQENSGPPAKDISSASCGQFVKFTVLMIDENDSQHSDLVTFWEGPITGTDVLERTKLRVQSVALLGAWGTYLVGGYHNSAYVREFYPASRILRTRYEYDCRR